MPLQVDFLKSYMLGNNKPCVLSEVIRTQTNGASQGAPRVNEWHQQRQLGGDARARATAPALQSSPRQRLQTAVPR